MKKLIFVWFICALANAASVLTLTPHNPRDERVFKHTKVLSLREQQSQFALLVSKLIVEATNRGYDVTLGESWRSEVVASVKERWYQDHGKGIANSLHTKRLAFDLNLFRDGKFLTETEDYATLGEWWELQCETCRWGGRFKTLPDGNHFSSEFGGVQ